METKKPAEVLLAFKHAEEKLGQLPGRLTTDAGSELTAVKKYLDERGKKYRTKAAFRSLATLANASGNLKKALARDLRKAETDDWASRLQKVIKGQSSVPAKNTWAGGSQMMWRATLTYGQTCAKNEDWRKPARNHIKVRGERLAHDGNYGSILDRKTSTRCL